MYAPMEAMFRMCPRPRPSIAFREAVHQLRERDDVELDLPRDAIPRQDLEVLVHAAARVVDQHVDREAFALGLREELRRRGRVGEVERDHRDLLPRADTSRLLRERVEVLGPARRDDEVRAARREEPRERGAEAAARARDQRPLSLPDPSFPCARDGTPRGPRRLLRRFPAVRERSGALPASPPRAPRDGAIRPKQARRPSKQARRPSRAEHDALPEQARRPSKQARRPSKQARRPSKQA